MKRLIVAVLLITGCSPSPSQDPSVRWLMSKQSEDGAWRSEVYGSIMGEGKILTPFVLLALAGTDADAGLLNKGVDFVEKHAGQTNEYPTYAAALSIRVLKRFRPESAKIPGLVAFLRGRQASRENGWSKGDPAFGGWDYGASKPMKPNSRRIDISTTAFVVEALRDAGVSRSDPVIRNAVIFSRRCRNDDGGFFFSPEKISEYQNKAGGTRSYGTATCDGIRVLEAAGEDATASRAWLAEHSPLDRPGGFPEDEEKQQWAEALTYYYLYIQVLVRPSEALREHILSLRRENGTWRNEIGLMKEDDPIMATALALAAISR